MRPPAASCRAWPSPSPTCAPAVGMSRSGRHVGATSPARPTDDGATRPARLRGTRRVPGRGRGTVLRPRRPRRRPADPSEGPPRPRGGRRVGSRQVLAAAGRTVGTAASSRPAVMCTPGSHPVEELRPPARRARRWLAPPAAGRARRRAQRACTRSCASCWPTQPAQAELVIVIDQFEELFTLCHDQREREQFIELVLTAAKADNSRCRVVLGIRADFYAHVTTHAELTEAMRDAQRGGRPDDDRRAAAGHQRSGRPRGLHGGDRAVDPSRRRHDRPTRRPAAAVARAAGDVAAAPGHDPHAGGLRARPAGSTARSRTPPRTCTTLAGRAAAGPGRQLFLRLTALGEGTEDTKRRIRRDELDLDDQPGHRGPRTARPPACSPSDGDGVEIAHEALIRSWPRLTTWLTEDREGLRVTGSSPRPPRSGTRSTSDPGALYRGSRLAIAREWAGRDSAALSARERRFLDASVAADAREARCAAPDQADEATRRAAQRAARGGGLDHGRRTEGPGRSGATSATSPCRRRSPTKPCRLRDREPGARRAAQSGRLPPRADGRRARQPPQRVRRAADQPVRPRHRDHGVHPGRPRGRHRRRRRHGPVVGPARRRTGRRCWPRCRAARTRSTQY